MVHSARGVCERCNDGYLLTNNTCEFITSKNCLVQANKAACLFCPVEFPVLAPGAQQCLAATSVPFCQNYGLSGDCQNCLPGYYLDKTCKKVTALVDHCQLYDSNQKCAECEASFVLVGDSCVKHQLFDENCERYALSDLPCVICNQGYVLIDGFCVQCISANKGCAVCDPQNLNVCLLCKPRFYMPEPGTCVADPNLKDDAAIVTVEF